MIIFDLFMDQIPAILYKDIYIQLLQYSINIPDILTQSYLDKISVMCPGIRIKGSSSCPVVIIHCSDAYYMSHKAFGNFNRMAMFYDDFLDLEIYKHPNKLLGRIAPSTLITYLNRPSWKFKPEHYADMDKCIHNCVDLRSMIMHTRQNTLLFFMFPYEHMQCYRHITIKGKLSRLKFNTVSDKQKQAKIISKGDKILEDIKRFAPDAAKKIIEHLTSPQLEMLHMMLAHPNTDISVPYDHINECYNELVTIKNNMYNSMDIVYYTVVPDATQEFIRALDSMTFMVEDIFIYTFLKGLNHKCWTNLQLLVLKFPLLRYTDMLQQLINHYALESIPVQLFCHIYQHSTDSKAQKNKLNNICTELKRFDLIRMLNTKHSIPINPSPLRKMLTVALL